PSARTTWEPNLSTPSRCPFLCPQSSQIECDLHGPELAGAHCISNCVAVLAQAEKGSCQLLEVQLRRRLQRELERALALLLGLRAVRIRAHHVQLSLPDRRPIDLLLAWHSDRYDGASAAREADCVV